MTTTPDKAVASAFQTAYNFLAQNRMCKLYRTEDGQWKCELIGEEK